jgi:nucleotide-binding universal stress UspA family protein
MFRDIVVPLDGSRFAERALGLAERIATAWEARLHLIRVHVVRDERSAFENAVDRGLAASYLNEVAWELERRRVEGVRVAVLDGSAALAIADYGDRMNADLIVMTTHGRTGIDRRRLGSVVAVVVHHARCPVLLVRGDGTGLGGSELPLERILVAVDGSERAEELESMAVRLTMLGRPSFRIMQMRSRSAVSELLPAGDPRAIPHGRVPSAVAKADDDRCSLAGRLQAAGLRAEGVVKATDEPARDVLEAADSQRADLIVLTTRLDSGGRILTPKVVEQLLHDSTVPVLLVREEE